MITLLGVTVKVAVLTLAALTAAAMLRRRSAAVRHFVLATALVCSLALPLLERVMPPWPVPLPAAWWTSPVSSSLRFVSSPVEPAAPARSSESVATQAAALSMATVFAAVWIAGAIVAGAVLLAGLLRLRRLAADSEPVSTGPWRDVTDDVAQRHGVRRHVRILYCQHPTMLATWGVFRPTILLPAGAGEWPLDRVHAVVRHELAHVRRGDWIVSMAGALLRAVYWFNPLLWIACHRLRHESELACDDLVLASGISGTEYATHLLAVARQSATGRQRWSPAIAIAHHSMLEGRVRAMLNARVNRTPVTIIARATTIAALAIFTIAIGVVSVAGETSHPVKVDARLGTLPVIAVEPGPRVEARAAAAPAAQAQPAGGTIEGVLYDPYGGLLPGTSVRLAQVGTGNTQNALSDRAGSFTFRGLAAGDYELVTELPGFITVKNVVRAEPGQTTRRHITLPIGTIEETILATCSTADRVTSPTAPTGSRSPGAASRQATSTQRGTEPKMPGAFTGGIGGQIKVPMKVAHANPVCPSTAAQVSTVVRLAGRIGIDGLLTDLHDVSPDADTAYVASALEAARQWAFTPTLLNNAPIEVNISISFRYSWSN